MISKLSFEQLNLTISELSNNEDEGIIGGYCTDDFPIYYANEKMAHMLGYSDVDDLIKGIDGKVVNTIHKEDLSSVIKDLNNGVYYEGMTYKTSYRMPRKDGTWFWTIDKGKIIKDDDGRLAIISVCYNMTDFLNQHERLAKRDKLSQATLLSMPGGYHQCLCSEGFPFIYLSERFLEMFDYSKEEIEKEFDNKFINMLHPDDRRLINDYIKRIENDYDTNKVSDAIYRMKSKRGYIWVCDATSLVKGDGEDFYHGTLTDISEFVDRNNKQKEELLQSYAALEEKQDIISSSKMGTWSINLLDNGVCKLNVDDRMRMLLGVSDDLNSEQLYDYWYKRIDKSAICSVLSSVEKMKQGLNDENTYLWNHPILGLRYVRCGGVGHKTKDGYVIRGYHYDVDEMVKDDINKHIQLENALVQEKKHTEIIDTLATLYLTTYLINLNTHQYEVVKGINENVHAGKIGDFDVALQKAVAHSVVDDMKEDVREFFDLNTLNQRLKDTNTLIHEHLDKNGKWYESRFIIKNREEDGTVLKVLYVSRDITKEKKHELDLQRRLKESAMEAKRANAAKTDFLRRMSHDIRTPLNGIIGILNLEDKYNDDEKRKEFKDKLLHSADYLLDLVNNILDISKLESGVVELENKAFCIDEVFAKITSTMQFTAIEHNINLYCDMNKNEIKHHNLIGSEVHLNRCLMNLVSNAIKYNKEGGYVRLACKELNFDKEKAYFEIICEDNGQGMSEDFIQRAYEPFTQENKGTLTGFTGSGLGLSIVKDIVTKMSGSIELQSKENKGTKFTIRLPFMIDNDISSKKKEVKIKDVDIKGLQALLVEDNTLNMEIAKLILEDEGLVVTCAKNGKEAIDIIKENNFDIIFMDVMMPIMDGITASKKIREMGVDTPIIAMTANAFIEDKKACLQAGMNAHIAKPLDIKLIDATIKGLLNKR